MEANKKLKLGKLFSPQNLRLYLYYLTTPSGKKKSYSHGYIKYFLKSNWNERTHFKLLPRPFSISKKCPSTEGTYKEYFTICNIHMYVWRLPPHTQKFTVRSVWGFLANFPTLRHSFHSTDFYFLIFFIFTLFYFTILCWFCHTLTWIGHGYTWVPNPEPPPTSHPISSL